MAPKKNPPPVEENSNVVVIELGESTLQVIRDLTQAIVSQKAPIINLKSVDSTVLEALVQGLTNNGGHLQPAPVANLPAPKQTPAAKTPAPTVEQATVTLTQIRELINAKVGEGKQPAIVALLQQHGAKNASTLDESNFVSFYQGLTEL